MLGGSVKISQGLLPARNGEELAGLIRHPCDKGRHHPPNGRRKLHTSARGGNQRRLNDLPRKQRRNFRPGGARRADLSGFTSLVRRLILNRSRPGLPRRTRRARPISRSVVDDGLVRTRPHLPPRRGYAGCFDQRSRPHCKGSGGPGLHNDRPGWQRRSQCHVPRPRFRGRGRSDEAETTAPALTRIQGKVGCSQRTVPIYLRHSQPANGSRIASEPPRRKHTQPNPIA